MFSLGGRNGLDGLGYFPWLTCCSEPAGTYERDTRKEKRELLFRSCHAGEPASTHLLRLARALGSAYEQRWGTPYISFLFFLLILIIRDFEIVPKFKETDFKNFVAPKTSLNLNNVHEFQKMFLSSKQLVI